MSRMARPDLSSPAPAAPVAGEGAGKAAGVDAAGGESEGLASIARQSTEKDAEALAAESRRRTAAAGRPVPSVPFSALTTQGPPPIIRGPLRRRGGEGSP